MVTNGRFLQVMDSLSSSLMPAMLSFLILRLFDLSQSDLSIHQHIYRSTETQEAL